MGFRTYWASAAAAESFRFSAIPAFGVRPFEWPVWYRVLTSAGWVARTAVFVSNVRQLPILCGECRAENADVQRWSSSSCNG